jgi:hypothetical protein
MNDLTLKLAVNMDQANLILGALAKLPYETVAGIIGNLTNQAQQQIAAHNEPRTGETAQASELPPSAEANQK